MTADERAFIEKYEALALRAMERHGFAIPVPPGEVRSPETREAMAKNRTNRALHALTDLRQWLVDDDPEVRQTARDGLQKLLYVTYVGEQPENRATGNAGAAAVDRVVARATRNCFPEDGPPPRWAMHDTAARLRSAAIVLTLGLAAATGALLVTGHLLLALPLLVLTLGFDVLEGSFARLVRLRDPHLRWFSFVSSQAADVVMLAGAAAAGIHEQPGMAGVAGGAAMLSLFAALSRASAVQAGYRYWRSPSERLARWSGIAWYILASSFGRPTTGLVGLGVLLLCSASYELAKVARGVERLDIRDGGFIMVNENRTVDSWRIEDDERRPGAGRPGRLPHPSLRARRRVHSSSRSIRAERLTKVAMVVTAAVAILTVVAPRLLSGPTDSNAAQWLSSYLDAAARAPIAEARETRAEPQMQVGTAAQSPAASAERLCGQGYEVVDKQELQGSEVWFLVSPQESCVVTIKNVDRGDPSHLSAFLRSKEGLISDAGYYRFYAGPVRAPRSPCSSWGGTEQGPGLPVEQVEQPCFPT